jgi:hypothetical protein
MGKGGSWPGAAVINGMDCPLTTTAVGVAGTEIVKMLLDDQAAKLLSSEVANMSQMLVHCHNGSCQRNNLKFGRIPCVCEAW